MSSAAFRRRRGGRFCAARVYPVTRRSRPRRHTYVRLGREHLGPRNFTAELSRACTRRTRCSPRITDYVLDP